jgi:hypothetical protein
MEEVCQLLVRQWISLSVTCPTMDKFVSYLNDYGGSLSVTCPTMEEVCQLLVRQWRDFFQLLDQQWRKFVSYLSADKLPPLLDK